MSEHKTKILEMLAEGKIDVSEAEKLLNAIEAREPPLKKERSELSQQFFNILVDSKKEEGAQVKIKVPLRLVKAGIKFIHLIPEESREKVQKAIRDKGIDFDLDEINSLNIDELLDDLRASEVSVEDGKESESVRIFCS